MPVENTFSTLPLSTVTGRFASKTFRPCTIQRKVSSHFAETRFAESQIAEFHFAES